MIFCNGKKGARSQKEVRLSIGSMFGYVIFHVWEDGKITHTFNPDVEFLKAMQNESGLDLRLVEDGKKKGKPLIEVLDTDKK